MTYQETKAKYQAYDLRSLVLFSNSATFKGDKKAIKDLVTEKKAAKESGETKKVNPDPKPSAPVKSSAPKKAEAPKKASADKKKAEAPKPAPAKKPAPPKKADPVKKAAPAKKAAPVKKEVTKKVPKFIGKERAPKGTTDDPRGSTITIKKMSDLPKGTDTKGFTIGDKVFDSARNESGVIISFTYYSRKPQYTYPRIETPTGKFLVGLKRLAKAK